MSSDSSHYSPQTQPDDKSHYSPQVQPDDKSVKVSALGVNTKASSVNTVAQSGVQSYAPGVNISVGEQSQVEANFHKNDLQSPSSVSRNQASVFNRKKLDVKSYSGNTFTEVNVADVKSRIRKMLNVDKTMKKQHSTNIKNWIYRQTRVPFLLEVRQFVHQQCTSI